VTALAGGADEATEANRLEAANAPEPRSRSRLEIVGILFLIIVPSN